MPLESCPDHPTVSGQQVCRACGEARCGECLAVVDDLVLPLCRPCAASAPTLADAGDVTMRFRPRRAGGWAVVHERRR